MSEEPAAVVETPAEESVNDSEEQGDNEETTEDTLQPACKKLYNRTLQHFVFCRHGFDRF